jgi:hypothetical protein
MITRYVLNPIPYPLHDIPRDGARLSTVDFRSILETLLAQTHGLAHVLARACRDDNVVDEDLGQGLDVLAGYCEAALALFECWEDDLQTRQAAAAEQRRQWVERPVAAGTAEALAEVHTMLAQCDTALVVSLVKLLRAFAPLEPTVQLDNTPPPEACPASPEAPA